jgi:hypothetical protein
MIKEFVLSLNKFRKSAGNTLKYSFKTAAQTDSIFSVTNHSRHTVLPPIPWVTFYASEPM